MTLREQQVIFLLNMCKLIEYATNLGFEVTGGELVRTIEQAELYKKTGFSKAGADSLHCKRLAIDLNFFKNGKFICDDIEMLAPIGNYWESLHPLNSWGGRGVSIVDEPHFSMGIGKPEWKRVTN